MESIEGLKGGQFNPWLIKKRLRKLDISLGGKKKKGIVVSYNRKRIKKTRIVATKIGPTKTGVIEN
jgi:hypothetical protein